MFTLILCVIFFVCFGFLFAEGLWGNAVRFINVLLAALLAMNLFEPLASKLEWWQPTYSYACDFLALWAVFCVFVIIFRAITDQLSKVQVRFHHVVNRIGGGVFAALIGWLVVAFTLTTLHTAPLGKTFFFDGFHSGEAMFLGTSPDLQWLGFTQHVSDGALCRSAAEEGEETCFDPDGEFLQRYDIRREAAGDQITNKQTFRILENEMPKMPPARAEKAKPKAPEAPKAK
jgi:hypothetical protein